MEHPVTFAICGCGNRGLEAYASYQSLHPERMRVVAGADSRPERLAMLRQRCGVAEDMCFASAEELLARPRLADVLIVATQDRQHVPHALAALERGYHLLVEKPISPDLKECIRLRDKAHEAGRAVIVCHVLRYTRLEHPSAVAQGQNGEQEPGSNDGHVPQLPQPQLGLCFQVVGVDIHLILFAS